MKFILYCISLLVLIASVYSDEQSASCGSNGVVDSFATSYCNCFSGYSPSDNTQSDCSVQAQCPALKSKDAATLVGSYRPSLTDTSFSNDRYNILVQGPIVSGRRNMTIRFLDNADGQPSEDSCGYPGVLWKKSENQLDCLDEVAGSIPWSTNGMCGFSKGQTDTTLYFFASVQIKYVDTITVDDGSVFFRTSGVLYNVSVTFPTQKTIQSSIVTTSNDGSTRLVVIGDVVYDSETRLAQVVVHAQTKWPFKIDSTRVAMFSTPGLPITASIVADPSYNEAATCTSVTNSNCDQQFIIWINPGGVCDLAGTYQFNLTLTCRDSNVCINLPFYGAYGILLYDDNICGSTGYDINLSEGSLTSFADQAGSTLQTSFVPNDWSYFQFAVNSPDVTIDTLTITQITAQQALLTQPDVLYDINQGGLNGIQTAGQLSSLTLLPSVVPAPPGVDATVEFKVQLVRAVGSFQAPAGGSATVTFSVTCDLTYHGNQKRSVTALLSTSTESAQSQGSTNIYVSNLNANNNGEALTEIDSSANSVFVSVLAIIISVFAFLF